MFKRFLSTFWLLILCVSLGYAQEDWMPDPNLRYAVREALGLASESKFTRNDLLALDRLDLYRLEIEDLTGLESAKNLTWFSFAVNNVTDLRPLAKLTKLQVLFGWTNRALTDISPIANLTELRWLNLGACNISDITPIEKLTRLEALNLSYNVIENITPLANLTNLTELWLTSNKIVDISPLENLTTLEELRIQNNRITDYSPLDALTLVHLEYDEVCDISSFSVSDRINGKEFPAVFAAWGGIGWSPVLNLPELSDLEHITLHDLYFSDLMFTGELVETNSGIKVVGNLEAAQQEREAFLTLNPNMVFLAELRMRDAFPNEYYHEDYPYWLRDEAGDRVEGWPGTFLLDFTHPGQQEIIVQQALAVAQCGLYDGIFLDWWNEDYPVLSDDWSKSGYRGNEAEQRARDTIIQRIRAGVGDDFLIIVNANRRKIPRTAPYINGTFMETLRDHDRGYTHDGLAEIESTLLWAEENLREPRVNCLEGWGIKGEPSDSPSNRKWMRVFTAMSLTHSDGYVLYNDGIQHEHYWYDFWDADLGQPIQEKARTYRNREGLFIREFTNGWAVYNRSGKQQRIQLPEQVSGVSSGIKNRRWHTVPDLDGEIYLKAVKVEKPADLNGDGVVNILDLVILASAFGKDSPDLNADGVVNILDLVIISNALD